MDWMFISLQPKKKSGTLLITAIECHVLELVFCTPIPKKCKQGQETLVCFVVLTGAESRIWGTWFFYNGNKGCLSFAPEEDIVSTLQACKQTRPSFALEGNPVSSKTVGYKCSLEKIVQSKSNQCLWLQYTQKHSRPMASWYKLQTLLHLFIYSLHTILEEREHTSLFHCLWNWHSLC